MRSVWGGLLAASVGLGALGLMPVASSTATAAPIESSVLGSGPATAAGSCWEIKQHRPDAPNGAYWLLTPTMAEPAQFYCDVIAKGGGWVLVGKGRDGWTDAYGGAGDAARLLSPGLDVMGPGSIQYPARTVDGLMGGGRVDELRGGIRLRRARNVAGSSWQESRLKLARRDRWVWTFGAEHPLRRWAIGVARGSGGKTANFGSNGAYRRVRAAPKPAQGYRLGFAYGRKVTGSSRSTSYLWSRTDGVGHALPYTEMYIRPQLSSNAGFTAIGAEGTMATNRPAVATSRALDSPWGVTGLAGSTSREGNVEVQAFTESGNTMFVGGNFASVQRDATGTGRVSQPFLAAFDTATGEFVQSFRPVLDEQVQALATLPDGTVVAGGRFTQVNGEAATAIVALDPVTGAVRQDWRVQLQNRVAPGKLAVRAFDVQDGWLYIGGALSHMTGGRRATAVATKNLGRVEVGDATPGTNWNPRLNGTVNDVDASRDGQRVYAAGYFGTSNGLPAKKAVALSTADGAPLAPQFAPTWSHPRNIYQRAVKEVGDRVYFGGSEHSLFGFDVGSMDRVSGSIMKKHGDIQAISANGAGLIYAGCHCDDYTYENAFTWRALSPGWTQADAIGWLGAWDAATGRQVPDFVPRMRMRLGSGIWAVASDSSRTIWAGGDIVSATTKSKAGKWAGGFVRFGPSDSIAPATPVDFRVVGETDTHVTLAWKAVTDAGGGVRYQVLRDDRTIAFTEDNTTTLTVPKGGENRFFVRATDKAGNLSASSSVLLLS